MIELTQNSIKYLMMEKNIKAIDIADALNISLTATYQKIRGEKEFKLEEIKQLGKVFNVDFVVKRNED